MPSEHSKNGNPVDWQTTAKLYDRLRRLHLEIANVYAELATPKPFQNAEKVVSINSKSGKLLANLSITDRKLRAEAATRLPIDNAPYTWLKGYLKSLTDKDEKILCRLGEKENILEYAEVEGNITPALLRKLESAFRWTFNRMIVDNGTPTDAPQPDAKSDTVPRQT